jgi:hypothetical protein
MACLAELDDDFGLFLYINLCSSESDTSDCGRSDR